MAATAGPGDRLGLALTAASGEAARAFDDTVWEYVSFGRDPGSKLKRALQADPQMPMALCLQGYFFHLMALPSLATKAGSVFSSLKNNSTATSRERAHIAALGEWCDGELERTCEVFEGILKEHPRDILALKLANYLYFYMGDAKGVRDGPAGVLPHWDGGVPGYSHVLALHAFGLEETGDHAAAERVGRRAAELNPADPWAVHAVAHVMEMQDRTAEGAAWIEGLVPHWDTANFFRFHLWWHLALLRWSEGRPDEALRLYDERVWAGGSAENLSLCNDISLLARLELVGANVGPRWDAAVAVVQGQAGGSVLAFVDAHYALALGEVPALHERGTNARVLGKVGRAACEAAAAWRRKDYKRVSAQLAPLRGELWRIGGSHAQRDLFSLLLIDSALKTNDMALARALWAERAALRPAGRLPAQLTKIKE